MTERVPAHLQPYVDALGEADAIRFLLAFGGAELYVPRDPKGQSRVARELGLDVARKLSEAQDRLPRRVPTAKPWIARFLRSREGLSVAEIARRLHTSDVTVRKYLNGDDPAPVHDPRQARLF